MILPILFGYLFLSSRNKKRKKNEAVQLFRSIVVFILYIFCTGWINVTILEKHSIHGFEKKVRHSIDLYTNMEGRKDDDEELVDSRKTRSHSRMKRFVMEFWLATNEERGNER